MPQAQPQRPGHRPCRPEEPLRGRQQQASLALSPRLTGTLRKSYPSGWMVESRPQVGIVWTNELGSWLAKLGTFLENLQRMKKAYQSTVFYRLTEGPWILKLPLLLKKKNPVLWLHVKTHFKCYSCKLERCDTMRPRQMGVLSVT